MTQTDNSIDQWLQDYLRPAQPPADSPPPAAVMESPAADAAPAEIRNSVRINWNAIAAVLNVAAVVVFVLYLNFRGGSPQPLPDDDKPRPVVDVAEASRQATVEFILAIGQGSINAADEVRRAGSEAPLMELVNQAINSQQLAFTQAHDKFMETTLALDEANIPQPDGEGTAADRKKLADYLQKSGEGILKAVK